jgi:hypothetical protein
VQKSNDGRNWITITNLPAAGNSSSTRQYSFIDNASAQNNFYRIAEVDISGMTNYSVISRVSCGNDAEFKLWPNPAINEAWVSVSVVTDEKANLRIIDQKGRLVYYKTVPLFAGNNTVNIDTRLLSSGGYIVELITNQNTKSTKLIKL